MMKSSMRRTISSISLGRAEIVQSTLIDGASDSCGVGDAELEIVYQRVPRKLLIYGSFYSLIQFRFFPFLALILSGIVAIIFTFAWFYLQIQAECGLHLNSFVDAWLFSVLAHFKAVLSSHEKEAIFWHGCPKGAAALFSQLFIGNILMSVLLSSLVFNFQSLSRRSISRFTTLTMGRRLMVDKTEAGIDLVLPLVELNEMHKRKVTGMKCHFYVFDPMTGGKVRSLAADVEIGEAPLPCDVRIALPTDLLTGESGRQSVASFDCPVCGKQADSANLLRKHAEAQSDAEHGSLIPNLPAPLNFTVDETLGALRGRRLEFVVIAEGQDAVTTDRIQVQKIFRHFELVPLVKQNVVSPGPAVDYSGFL